LDCISCSVKNTVLLAVVPTKTATAKTIHLLFTGFGTGCPVVQPGIPAQKEAASLHTTVVQLLIRYLPQKRERETETSVSRHKVLPMHQNEKKKKHKHILDDVGLLAPRHCGRGQSHVSMKRQTDKSLKPCESVG